MFEPAVDGFGGSVAGGERHYENGSKARPRGRRNHSGLASVDRVSPYQVPPPGAGGVSVTTNKIAFCI